MKWPWVSRDRLTVAEANYSGVVDRLHQSFDSRDAEYVRFHATLSEQSARYDALLDRYHALKLQGATIPAPPPERVKPDPVTQAIRTKSKGNLALQKHYSTLVHALRAEGQTEEQIVAGILEGDSLAETGVPE